MSNVYGKKRVGAPSGVFGKKGVKKPQSGMGRKGGAMSGPRMVGPGAVPRDRRGNTARPTLKFGGRIGM